MTIVQITACSDVENDEQVFGIGNDQKVYKWKWLTGEWVPYQKNK